MDVPPTKESIMKCSKCDNKEWAWIYNPLKNTNIVSLERTCADCLTNDGWFEHTDEYGRSTGIRGNQYLSMRRDYRGSELEETWVSPIAVFTIY
tara:strand:- start:275 stop:556 length:282 start_codon:yes stop_codon:yes gene_type:complete